MQYAIISTLPEVADAFISSLQAASLLAMGFFEQDVNARIETHLSRRKCAKWWGEREQYGVYRV